MRYRKITAFFILFLSYTAYSGWVYTSGTEQKSTIAFTSAAQHGKELWQQYNCAACHQLYGLGGYIGPDLTNIISDTKRGKDYAAAFLKHGGATMPDFHLPGEDVASLLAYLQYIDASMTNNDPLP